MDTFSIDDRAAELNQGSYRSIPRESRLQAIKECEDFIAEHTRARRSFAVETTLRSEAIFRQAAAAKGNGFTLEMRYISVEGLTTNVERIANRADQDGRSQARRSLREALRVDGQGAIPSTSLLKEKRPNHAVPGREAASKR